jgi:hypothetical protein
LWDLGGHRVLCGNALDAAIFAAVLGGDRAAMVFTDPPYNVPIDGHASGLGAIHHRPFPMASGEMDSAQFAAFLVGVFRNLAAFRVKVSPGHACYRSLDHSRLNDRDGGSVGIDLVCTTLRWRRQSRANPSLKTGLWARGE